MGVGLDHTRTLHRTHKMCSMLTEHHLVSLFFMIHSGVHDTVVDVGCESTISLRVYRIVKVVTLREDTNHRSSIVIISTMVLVREKKHDLGMLWFFSLVTDDEGEGCGVRMSR